jgi:hypothetical protein
MVEINYSPPFPNPDEKIIRIVKFVQYQQHPSQDKFWRVECQIPEGYIDNFRAFERLSECIEEFLEDFEES